MIVVDASIALAWVLPDTEDNHRYSADVAGAALDGLHELIAPRLLTTECSYRLLKHGRRYRWGGVKIAEHAETIDLLGLRYFELNEPIATMVRFAERYHVQGYDAVYLALAMAKGAMLATLDGGLKTAARAARVPLYEAATS